MARITTRALGAVIALGVDLCGPLAAQETVVVELFTSQGCAACPPADALLGALSVRDDVVALALHVDYWNYLGWSDTFGAPANTQRQRDYARALGERMIYTPQMVIDGAVALVGSRRGAVMEAVAAAGATPHSVAVTVARDGEMIRIAARAAPGTPSEPADVVYFVYDQPQTVAIARGENAGRAVTYVNPVRAWMPLARWEGGVGAWSVPAPIDARGVAVVVQAAADGRVLGAAKVDLQRVAAAAAVDGVTYNAEPDRD